MERFFWTPQRVCTDGKNERVRPGRRAMPALVEPVTYLRDKRTSDLDCVCWLSSLGETCDDGFDSKPVDLKMQKEMKTVKQCGPRDWTAAGEPDFCRQGCVKEDGEE
ncbi:hypothetical protein Bbelb_015440 [Branchiostoma belcheri]|nr:hypothetical protein Bbelb_015440 [Branchiostoma belcheri]